MYKQIATFAIAVTLALLARKRISMAKKLTLFGIVLLLAGVPFAQESPVSAYAWADRQDYTRVNLPEGALARLGKGHLSGNWERAPGGTSGLVEASMVYSPDGMLLAVTSTLGVWLYDAHTGTALALLAPDTGGAVSELVFSPDGATLAGLTGDEEATVILWDMSSGEEKAVLRHEDTVDWAVFSPDSATLASVSSGTVRLWDVSSGEQKAVLEGHAHSNSTSFSGNFKGQSGRGFYDKLIFSYSSPIAFSPDGATLAGVSGETVRLWDVSSGEQKAVRTGGDELGGGGCGGMYSVAFLPDGATLAIRCGETLRLWYLSVDLVKIVNHSLIAVGGVFSPDGATLAGLSGDVDARVRLWDVSSGEQKAVLGRHPYHIAYRMMFSPDGKMLATAVWPNYQAGYPEYYIRLNDVSSGEQKAALRVGWVTSMAFSPDGATLASISHVSGIQLWDTASGEQKGGLGGYGDGVNSVAFSPPDGALLASGSGGTVRLWDVSSGEEKAALWHGRITALAFSPPDGALLASGGAGYIRLWDVSSGEQKAILWHDGITSMAFSPDGATLASGGGYGDNTVRLWDVSSGELKVGLRHWGVKSMAFSPDGKTLASGDTDNTVRLWDVSYAAQKTVFRGHEDEVTALAFSPPDGAMLASGSSDNTVRLWDVSNGEEKAVFRGHEGRVTSVAFSPDGALLVSGGGYRDNTVRLWDVSSGEEKAVFRGHEDRVYSVAFSPDGALLASGSNDNTVLLWDMAYSPTSVADFDGNGQVDFADFLVFIAQFGTSRGDSNYDAKYDLDGDGTIGFSDFLIFTSLFGTSG